MINKGLVEGGAWFAYQDRQSLLEDHANVHKGMPPKDAPKMTSVGPSSNTIERTTIFTAQSTYKTPQAKTLCLGRTGTACCKLPKPQKDLPCTPQFHSLLGFYLTTVD